MSEAPKSAIEIVMERLRKKDVEAGVEEKALTDEQRAAIADVRSICEAAIAQRRIMHSTAIMTVFDPAERAERDDELRRDIERFQSERDAKIAKIHAGQA